MKNKKNCNMTKQEMLDELSLLIRKNIPRLMELREGCIIELDNVQAKISLSNYEFENGCTHLLRNKERLWYATDEDLKHSKIIGHDIMLNDVLEWLRNCKRKIIFDYKTGYFLDEFDYYYSFSSNYHENAPIENKIWNLSSSYLKDQSEELIKFLYNIKINK